MSLNSPRCRCSAEFCYKCGLKWKTCGCTHWDPAILIARAGEAEERPVFGESTQEELAADTAATQGLQNSNDCKHIDWEYLRGPHACGVCHAKLRVYIFKCRECNLQSCEPCRVNRL